MEIKYNNIDESFNNEILTLNKENSKHFFNGAEKRGKNKNKIIIIIN